MHPREVKLLSDGVDVPTRRDYELATDVWVVRALILFERRSGCLLQPSADIAPLVSRQKGPKRPFRTREKLL
jgi:hypothetical protein